MNGAAPADDFCREVSEQVLKAKQSAEMRRNFMEFEYMQMLAKKDAREAGWKEGHKEGFDQGHAEGHAEGRAEGIEEGKKKGREEGEKIGREEGEKRGRNAERLETYGSLVRDCILSLPDAVKRSGLGEDEIRAWIRQNNAS